ncbi:hypothetical protein EDC04DRAFT_2905045 [Pisolithus marmoratus]|nr:hypothetical protein EDC04DRAFT_2905045 [Pisolithus marmoratus]
MYPGQRVPSTSFCEELLDVTHAQRYSMDHDAIQWICPIMRSNPAFSIDYTPRSMRSPVCEFRADYLSHINLTPWYTSPRAFSMQSTPSRGHPTYLQMISSPSPLSRSPNLLYPDFSPPFQRNTPFERQFGGDPPYDGYISFNTELSPVARKDSFYSPQSSSLTDGPTNATPPCNDRVQTSELFSITERVSLIEKFKSAAPGSDGESPKRPISPVSDASSLTPLSSPDLFVGRRAPRGAGTPPTSPARTFVRGATKTAEANRRNHEQQVRPSPHSAYLTEEPSKRSDDFGLKRKPVPDSTYAGENCHRRKKPRLLNAANTNCTLRSPECDRPTRRHLPAGIPYHPQFSLFYRRFPC